MENWCVREGRRDSEVLSGPVDAVEKSRSKIC